MSSPQANGATLGRRNATLSVAIVLVCTVATVVVATTLRWAGPSRGSSLLWLVLPAMALVAELIPVDLDRRGLRVTFALPYVAGMCIAAGPLGAILTDMGATLFGALLGKLTRRQVADPIWVVTNTVVAGLSSSLACFAMTHAESRLSGVPGEEILTSCVFISVYCISNLGVLSYLTWAGSGHIRMRAVISSLGVGLWSLALYVIVVVAVVTLVNAKAIAVVPLTLVPVWALRTALDYHARMLDHYYETVTALTQMLQRAHPYTHGHVERVGRAAEEVGIRLGLPARRARLLREAAVLHDIGKIAVDEEVLDKPARLTDEEMAHVRRHAEAGARILEPVRELAPIVPWIRHHHERPDGKGYPSGLAADQIPLESRIIAVIDAFDAMTGGDAPGQARPYKPPLSTRAALAELDRNCDTQFDRAVVQAFREVVSEEVPS